MAYVVNQEDENLQNQPQNQPNGVPVGSPSGLIQPEVSGANAGGPPANKPTQSGSFTNIQQYLAANADQAKPLADRVSSNVTNLAFEARSGLGEAQNKFKSQVESQVPQLSANHFDLYKPTSVTPNLEYYSPTSSSFNVRSKDPNGWMVGQDINQAQKHFGQMSAEEKADTQKALSAQYMGPNSIEETGLLQPSREKALEAQKMADLSNSEAGRFDLIRRSLSNPTASRGGQRLDQLLLQANPEAKDVLDQIRSNVGNLKGEFDTGAAESNALVDPTRKKIDSNKAAIKSALEGIYGGETKNLDNVASYLSGLKGHELDTVRKQLELNDFNKVDSRYGALLNTLTGRTTTNKFDPYNYKNVNPQSYLDPLTNVQANRSTVAGNQDREDLQALEGLLGLQNTALQPREQTGMFNPNAQFDRGGYQKGVKNLLQNYNNQSDLSGIMLPQGIAETLQNADVNYQSDVPQYQALANGTIEGLQRENSIRASLGLPQLDLSGLTANRPQDKQSYFDVMNRLGDLSTQARSQRSGGILDPRILQEFSIGGGEGTGGTTIPYNPLLPHDGTDPGVIHGGVNDYLPGYLPPDPHTGDAQINPNWKKIQQSLRA